MPSLTRHARGLGLSPRRRAAKGAALPSIVQDGPVAGSPFDQGSGQTLTDDTRHGPVDDRALFPAEVEQNRQALEAVAAPSGITLP